jgi:pyruvate/2-oxoglutarate dehydrogenase complex dihydrolipoamide acyltransferase (E2) component
MARHVIAVPELDLPGRSITLVGWLVVPGEFVMQGDRVAEIVAGEAAVDLESPATGILVEQLAVAADSLSAGQTIGVVVSRD